MKWQALAKREPRLSTILAKAEAQARKKRKPAERVCANDLWYGTGGRSGLKGQVVALVGYGAADSKLATVEAYETAVATVYAALPNCQNCGCM